MDAWHPSANVSCIFGKKVKQCKTLYVNEEEMGQLGQWLSSATYKVPGYERKCKILALCRSNSFFEIYTRHLYPERSSKLFKPDSHYDPCPGFLEGQTTQWPKEKRQLMIYKTYTENNRSNNTNLTKNQGWTQVIY